jgi:alpha-tubulin suppressor-like RCC1 family protein
VFIDCGDFHSLALENNGTLYSWGAGEKGECGHGKFEDVETPQRIKYFDGKTIVKVAAGNHHTLALT